MVHPTMFNAADSIQKIHDKEKEYYELEERLSALGFELQEMKKKNAAHITIQWKESILNLLAVDKNSNEFDSHFLKTSSFISSCVAWAHGVEITRDIKNNISSTLSFMFKNKAVGRIEQNGKTYYGLPEYFEIGKEGLLTLKGKYKNKVIKLSNARMENT